MYRPDRQPEYPGQPLDKDSERIRPQLRQEEQGDPQVSDCQADQQDDQRLRQPPALLPEVSDANFCFFVSIL